MDEGAACLSYLFETPFHHVFDDFSLFVPTWHSKRNIFLKKIRTMDFEDVRFQISEALRQFNSQQITLLMEWLEEVISKHRTNHSNFLPMKYNGGQCFACPCGRTFAIETTIRETTNVDASSPPATPMLQSKIDYKQLHSMSESNPKRPRILNVDANNLLIHNSQNNNIIAERINSSSILTSWPSSSIKTYENSPG